MILTKCSGGPVNFDRLIEEKQLSDRLEELLLIVPTNRKIRFLRKELISSSRNKASGSFNLETIGTFSSKLIFSSSFSDKIVSDAVARVLLKQSFTETDLRYFSQYKDEIPDGTLERVRNVISEYKKHGISCDRLLQEAEKLETSEKLKAIDIAAVYKAYNRRCAEIGVKEIGDIYSDINSLTPAEFEERFRKLFPKVNLILIDGFDEFTSPETIIFNLLANLENCNLYLRFDYYQSNDSIFSHLNGSYDKLLEKGFEKKTDSSFTSRREFREIIRQSLFHIFKSAKRPGFENSIAVISAGNRQKEVELISKEIKSLISKEKAEPHKICVVFNLIQQYSPAVRDIFTLNGIPFNLTDRYSLSVFQPVIEIISFLEILENDFYYKDIFRVLGSTLFEKNEIDASNLLETAVKLKLVAGYDNWINQINDAADAIDNSRADDAGYFRGLNFKKASSDLKKLKKKLEPFNRDLTPAEFFKSLQNFIYERKIPLKLINGEEERKEENIKSIEVFLDTIQELVELFILEYGKEKIFPLGFYLSNIRTAVKSTRFNIKEKSNYGILVTNLNEIRGLTFDYLFIAGLTDGDLPTRYSPEIFLSGSFAKNDMRHLTEQRYHFYQSLCSWEKGLYLSYPEKEKKKELVKSNFLAEFIQLFNVRTITEECYRNNIYNNEDVLKIAGITEAGLNYKIVPKINFNNDSIKNDIQFFSGREAGKQFEGNGFIFDKLSDEEKNNLALRKHITYSITQLETYAKCPFRFFIERVLSLNEIEEPSEDVEAFEMGNLLHDILYEFYKTMTERKTGIIGYSEEEALKALNTLFEIAEKKVNQSGFHSPFSFYEKERILGIEGKREESILYSFYLAERERNPQFIPSYFETGFGKSKNDEYAIIDFSIEGINIGGKIDRIDVDKNDFKYKIADYKLNGKKPKEEELFRGLSLQLPLYMQAAKELLEEKTGAEYTPASAEIYSLKPGKDFGSKPILPKGSRTNYDKADEEKKDNLIEYNVNLINTCKEKIIEFVNDISSGKFNVSEHKDREDLVCRYCAYSSICRVEEISSE